ncbi:MAG UNVERIFIED_CONTAM: hypothetical protein LVR29_11375 [Microcystis novacekii LVE1205-3]|jgi:hypothetical protein
MVDSQNARWGHLGGAYAEGVCREVMALYDEIMGMNEDIRLIDFRLLRYFCPGNSTSKGLRFR